MKHTEASSEAGAALLRQIPAVDELLARAALRDATRRVLQSLRGRISSGDLSSLSVDMLENEIVAATETSVEPSLRAVVNATGVILHTNLGRAPLAPVAARRAAEIASRYSNLEYDLERGERGRRDAHTDRLFRRLLGAEMTLVVNNNAAAMFLALNTIAEGGEVVVSRGELIEIGGSFRIPDISAKSGAVLREVGTTNRTRISDFEAAINERTRALVRVHPSNFRIVGFTERPELREMVELARNHGLPLIEDLGSGCLVDLGPHGIEGEPLAGESLKAGVDVVTFSGDKLLGGPQAGVLTGSRPWLERIRKNPLFRALRVDKLTIAALEATVALYLGGDLRAIPALAMIQASKDEIAERAGRLAERLLARAGVSARLEDGESVIGGGSTPGSSLPTRLVSVRVEGLSAAELAARLRRSRPPVIARVERGEVLLDLRTVLEGEDELVSKAFEKIALECA